jgi:uncharacterized damage-inducible protein DinB
MSAIDLVRHAEYNAWATGRLAPAVLPLTQDEFHRTVGGSFPSVHATCAHLVGVGELWLSRWRRHSPARLPGVADFPSTPADMIARWKAIDSEIYQFVQALPRPGESIEITNTSGAKFTHTYADMILHLVNHQSYHRGQLTAQLRMLGKQVNGQDFILFLREG